MSMYPFLFPFLSEERWLSYGKHCLNWSESERVIAQRLLQQKMIPLQSGLEIAVILGVSEELILSILKRKNKYYNTFSIKKKSGGEREITAPRVFLKVIQRYILDCVLSPNLPCEYVVGFVRGRSPAVGAARHICRPFLWNIDLRDFFPSIAQTRVKGYFLSLGYPSMASDVLSSLCCLNGVLPQGAPTSPAIANGVFSKVDTAIVELCSRHDNCYTRYADDLSFSGLRPIDEIFQRAVLAIIKEAGFSVNSKKTRLMGPKCRREVTGLTVNNKVSIPRPKRRVIRAWFHNNEGKQLTPENMQKMRGVAAWVAMYHEEGHRYLQQLERMSTATGEEHV